MNNDLWYFAHPYTAPTSEERISNFSNACFRTAQLLYKGYNVFSPIAHSHLVDNYLQKFNWIEFDNLVIAKTDFKGIILAPKWETSKGCIGEKEIFESKGLEVLLYTNIMK